MRQNPAWIQISEKKQVWSNFLNKVSSQHKWNIHELCISENFTETSSYFVSIFSWNMSLHSSKRLLGHKKQIFFLFPFLSSLSVTLFLLCLYLSSLPLLSPLFSFFPLRFIYLFFPSFPLGFLCFLSSIAMRDLLIILLSLCFYRVSIPLILSETEYHIC